MFDPNSHNSFSTAARRSDTHSKEMAPYKSLNKI